MQIAGSPAARSPACSHGESGPASSPRRMIVSPMAAIQHARSSGSEAVLASVMMMPSSSTMQTAVSSSEDIQAGEIFHETLLDDGPTRPMPCRSASSGGRGDVRNQPIFPTGADVGAKRSAMRRFRPSAAPISDRRGQPTSDLHCFADGRNDRTSVTSAPGGQVMVTTGLTSNSAARTHSTGVQAC